MAYRPKQLTSRTVSDRIKGPWSPEEDEALRAEVRRNGPRNWSVICKAVPGRSGKSCRLRWCNQLSPQVEHRPFTAEEDATILRAHRRFGNKWATISRLLTGHTDNAVKNHWNSTLKRKYPSESFIGSGSGSGSASGSGSEAGEDPVTSLSLSPPGSGDGPAALAVATAAAAEGGEMVEVVREMVRKEVRSYVSGVERSRGVTWMSPAAMEIASNAIAKRLCIL